MAVRSTVAFALQLDPANRSRSPTLDVNFLRSDSKLRRNVSTLSSFKTRFHYERGKEHSLFVLLIFFALALILTARFNRRSIKETKNALFHARSGNGPLWQDK